VVRILILAMALMLSGCFASVAVEHGYWDSAGFHYCFTSYRCPICGTERLNRWAAESCYDMHIEEAGRK
jgi:hypothetical protein